MSVPALQTRLSDLIAEYEEKLAALPAAIEAFEAAGKALEMAATVKGTYAEPIKTGHAHISGLQHNLRKSAWRAAYEERPEMAVIMSAKDKKRFEHMLSHPPEFTVENIREQFGPLITDPRYSILRGLAEVFCELDQSFKSHDRNKIGVKGLPSRIIISGFNGYSTHYGWNRVADVVNAIASYTGEKILNSWQVQEMFEKTPAETKAGRGLELRRFGNGNGHLHFTKATLEAVNKALGEFYGEVLPDGVTDKPTERQASTAVSKDLQYYPTPVAVVDSLLSDIYIQGMEYILEPSCGCGRIMDGIAKRWPDNATIYGIEVHPDRAREAKEKGHAVRCANFLDVQPEFYRDPFDRVVMNPPFYGRHYAKHVEHAMKFLRPGGKLHAILPVTARLDHGLIESMGYRHSWEDLPVGSFRESGTNINTTVLTMEKSE